MENKSSGNRFGRFWWLWLLCAILSTQIGLALKFGEGIIQFASNLIIALPLLFIGIFLHNKALQEDIKNSISNKPFRNIFLPWSKPAISLAIFVFVELLISTPLFAYTFYPCSNLDVIRKVNGCISHIPHQGLVQNIAFSKDGKTFATSEFEGDVKVWSYPDLTLLSNLGNEWTFVTNLSLSSDGKTIAICSWDVTDILETRTGTKIHTLAPNNKDGCKTIFTPDNKSVYIISESEIQEWDISTWELSKSITQENLEYLEISNDGNLLATGSRNGLINIRYASDGTILTTFQQPYLLSLAFSYDGKYLLTTSWDIESMKDDSKPDVSMIEIWNIETGKIEYTKTLQGVRIENIASSKNSYSFVAGEESCFRQNSTLFDMPCSFTWKNLNSQAPIGLRVPNGIYSLMFSPIDGKVLIGSSKNLYIWQVP